MDVDCSGLALGGENKETASFTVLAPVTGRRAIRSGRWGKRPWSPSAAWPHLYTWGRLKWGA